jgi:hypothetical protein
MTILRVFVVAAALAAALVPMPAGWIERWYSRGLYIVLQNQVTSATNLTAYALLDVASALVLLALVVAFWRRRRRTGLARAGVATLVTVVTLAAAVYLAFLAMWGLNYRRLPLEAKLEFDQARVTRERAMQLGELAVGHVNTLYAQRENIDELAAVASLRSAFARAQARLGQDRGAVPGIPKKSLLGFYFRRAAIDGMTDPLFLEVIVNPDVLPMEYPFVVAHEWAHLAGYAAEDEANFVAWLTCTEAASAALGYSGWLVVYEHVANVLGRAERQTLAAMVAEGPRQDLRTIAARYETSTPIVRNAARDVYDGYLRANRVREGIASYTGVVRLLLGTGAAEGQAPRLIAR